MRFAAILTQFVCKIMKTGKRVLIIQLKPVSRIYLKFYWRIDTILKTRT